MRNLFRVLWVVCMVGVLAFLLNQKSAAQQELRPPMPPNLFTIHKLTDRLSIIAPSGPDMSQEADAAARPVRHQYASPW